MPEHQLIVGLRALAEFLTARGYRVTYATTAKLASPKIGRGPPIEGYVGQSPCFAPEKALAWYRAQMITPEKTVLVTKRKPKTEEERRAEKERRRCRRQRTTEREVAP